MWVDGEGGKDSVMKAEVSATDGKGTNGFIDVLSQLASGMVSTLVIFFLTLIFSLPLGLLLTFIRMSKLKVLQWIAKIYISIMRGTPLMLQLLVVFFLPYYINFYHQRTYLLNTLRFQFALFSDLNYLISF